ncbi:class I SAM-dependent methyltransferase [Rubrivivax gelatinosus]|uniref:class I SAM-dependent methyltransferase n=1 Tax=Rubrivivax gelatinosus TaxID=28068 RepID=UPI0005C264E6|nr:class I SAM-dependent methyltransferase [Rubrivivax gelatinosus]MBG6080390.1 2-polyprenyl-3-methyl-5-hydroxy-6-metoxy-1,4-benzoquinol methylase [Rubrivivax gelatinosus]
MVSTRYGESRRLEMLRFIPATASRILDIGCHTGTFGANLKAQRSVEVWGVEPDPDAAPIAAGRLDRVLAAPYSESLDIPPAYFDVVVFNDVLEHLVDPWDVLRSVRHHLAPDGFVLASVPNVLHQSNLLHLLKERDFRYEDAGIRDRTHLRFFTAKSARRMFEEADYQVDSVEWINENWYPSSLAGRLAYRFFAAALHETKFIQIAICARPRA